MTATLVTIAIPTYNRARLLERALASARAQDYPHLEILILDNASPDETATIAQTAAAEDRRIRYIRQERNIGPTRNFNAALQLARGGYFMWLADDDWIDPDYVSACAGVLDRDPEVVLAGGTAVFLGAEPFLPVVPVNLRQSRSEARTLAYLANPRENSVFYGLHRLERLRAVGMHNVLAGDWLTVAMLAAIGNVATVPGVRIHRSHDGTGANPRRIQSVLGLPWWHGHWPKMAIAVMLPRLFVRHYPFDNLVGIRRWRLAGWMLLLLASRKNVLRWCRWLIPASLRPSRQAVRGRTR